MTYAIKPTIAAMTPEQAAGLWPQCQAMLAAACDNDIEGKVTLGGLYDQVMTGHSLLIGIWVDDKIVACGVVCSSNLQNGRHVFVQAVGGAQMAIWIDDFVDFLECTARAANCVDGILFVGRPGWRNVLTNLGFKTLLVTMRREVHRI